VASRRRGRARERVTVELERFVERAVRRLQVRVYQALTSASPVDTGFFRAGWSPSTGTPDRGGPELPGNRADRAATQAQAAGLLSTRKQASDQLGSSYKLSQGVVFIVNNVRYGVYLNEGSSAQAPAMFVEQAIAIAVAATQRELGT